MRKLILITFILWINFAFSQSFYEVGEIFYRDGTSEKGYLKVKNSEIKFKKKNTDKKATKFTYKKVEKIIINEEGSDFEYQYKIIRGKKKGKIKLLKKLIIGKASLFYIKHQTTLGNHQQLLTTTTSDINFNNKVITITNTKFPNNTNSLIYYGADFYIGKEESSSVEFIGSNSIAVGRKSIRKGLINYFKDCKKLITKLKNKEFKNKDIIKVVNFHNKECSSKKQ